MANSGDDSLLDKTDNEAQIPAGMTSNTSNAKLEYSDEKNLPRVNEYRNVLSRVCTCSCLHSMRWKHLENLRLALPLYNDGKIMAAVPYEFYTNGIHFHGPEGYCSINLNIVP